MQMSQQLGQAQQQAHASLAALQEQIQNQLDRKYSLLLMMRKVLPFCCITASAVYV